MDPTDAGHLYHSPLNRSLQFLGSGASFASDKCVRVPL
jgi:hypothetical protein